MTEATMTVDDVQALTGKRYLSRLPTQIPAGHVLVHNSVRPRRRVNASGARAWLEAPDPTRLEICRCGWAPELGRHFRVRKVMTKETGR
jgi:hypothetical protein